MRMARGACGVLREPGILEVGERRRERTGRRNKRKRWTDSFVCN